MTAQKLRELVVKTAMRFLGRKESDGSHKEIIDIYNAIRPLPNGFKMKYTDPWCAAFVSAVAWLCNLVSIIFPSASCPDMVNKYKKAGRWMENDDYTPKIGDVVFYDWDDDGKGDNTGTPDHVGIVTEVFSASFNVIEGNASDMVKIRTMKRNGRYIRGFGLPDYDAAAAAIDDDGSDDGGEIVVNPPDGQQEQAPSVSNPNTPSSDTFELRFRILRYGAGMGDRTELREQVRALQRALRSLGFDVGPDGLDGEFGPNTLRALRQYQTSVRIASDGEAGPETYSALNGLL